MLLIGLCVGNLYPLGVIARCNLQSVTDRASSANNTRRIFFANRSGHQEPLQILVEGPAPGTKVTWLSARDFAYFAGNNFIVIAADVVTSQICE